MSKKFKYVIRVPLNMDRDIYKPSLEWTRNRINLFKNYTLKSILNQSFQDFDIWLLCNKRYKEYTNNLEWNPKIKLVYDKGKQEVSKVNTDYLVLIRIDSDDLFHKNAISNIHMKIKNKQFNNNITKYAFKRGYRWNIINNTLKYWQHKKPPFFVHVFPKRVYSDWDLLKSLHYNPHGTSAKNAEELPKNKVCVLKHDNNVRNYYRNKEVNIQSKEEKERLLKKGHFITIDKKEINKIIKDFGVKKV